MESQEQKQEQKPEIKAGGNLVHEAEVQRQFMRLQLPVEVEISGKRYISDDWSNGGLSLRWPAEELAEGNTLIREGVQFKALLLFKFGMFDINVPVELEVRNIAARQGRVGCRFINLSGAQLSLLQFIVNAYVTGEIVRVGDIIEIVSRNNTAPKRSIPADTQTHTPARRLKQAFNWLLVAGASVLLLAYIGVGIWERAFVVRSDAAVVLSEPLVVEATKSGQIFFQPIKPGARVAKGAPLLMVRTDNGNMESVDSPCNCILRERLLDNHARVHTGMPVLRLLSADASPYIEARMPTEDALRFSAGATVKISLPGKNTPAEGHVINIEAGQEHAGEAVLYIEPKEKLGAEYIGGPATVRLTTFQTGR